MRYVISCDFLSLDNLENIEDFLFWSSSWKERKNRFWFIEMLGTGTPLLVVGSSSAFDKNHNFLLEYRHVYILQTILEAVTYQNVFCNRPGNLSWKKPVYLFKRSAVMNVCQLRGWTYYVNCSCVGLQDLLSSFSLHGYRVLHYPVTARGATRFENNIVSLKICFQIATIGEEDI